MSAPRAALSRAVSGLYGTPVELTPIAGDASGRMFWRVRLPQGGTRVVMDHGGPWTGASPDAVMSRIFLEAGLPVARVLEEIPAEGLLVLEDLGDDLLEGAVRRAAGHPTRLQGLYRAATGLARDIAVRGTPVLARSERASGPALDAERFRFEMDFFATEYARALAGIDPSPRLRTELRLLADTAAASSEPVLCHRDYHSRNLLVLPGGGLAMVDIQDARWGPDAYDLASLLRDAYVDLPEPLVEEMIALFVAIAPHAGEPGSFRARFDLVAAQRMIKALGTFGHQAVARGNRRYLEAVPRVLARLSRALPLHPLTAELGRELERAGLLG